jgi:hypothetical protein
VPGVVVVAMSAGPQGQDALDREDNHLAHCDVSGPVPRLVGQQAAWVQVAENRRDG